jgi:erythromycin esterase
MPDTFRAFAADRSLPLATIDPGAALDDLEPLADVFRAARVIAIGENAHLVREFYQWRHRLLRFLAERCGFTVFAMESGFSEGLPVDAWVRGGPGDLRELAERGITYRMGRCREMRDHLAWMRDHNRVAPAALRFFGLDLPGSTASALPALDSIGRYLETVDADAVPLVGRLVAQVGKFAGEHPLPAYSAYAALGPAERDAITARLAELAGRFDALAVDYCRRGGAEAYRVARHELRLAGLLDLTMRGYAGDTPDPRVVTRDRGLAETVFWLLDRFGPDTKIVLGAHNSHLQRTPFATPAFALSTMGHHLAHRLGGDYLAVGVTCAAGRTTTRRADPDAPGGVEIAGSDLASAVDGSVEAAMPPGLQLLDLRPARGRMTGPGQVRIMDGYQDVAVLDAYDLVVSLPRISTAEQVSS